MIIKEGSCDTAGDCDATRLEERNTAANKYTCKLVALFVYITKVQLTGM